MRTLDEFACSSVGGGDQDPKVTAFGAALIAAAVEGGKFCVAAGSTAGGLVFGAPAAGCGGYIIGTYGEQQLTKHFGFRDWVADCIPHTPGLDLVLLGTGHFGKGL